MGYKKNRYRKFGNDTISFGKYQGSTLNEIKEKDPWYLVWLYDYKKMNIDPNIVEECRKILNPNYVSLLGPK